MYFKVEKVLERDIDLLIINNIINNKLLNLFLDKICIDNYKVIEVELSHVDDILGESDITIIVEKDNHKIGLLIEDKIDARAMKLQPERYIERGNRGISNNIYNEFKTFVVAPQEYLDTNIYVDKYQYKISYEELLEVLSDDIYASTLLNKALEEKEIGYNVIENDRVTNFWNKYYEFVSINYPTIRIHEVNGPRGTRAAWAYFDTGYSQVKIVHKLDRGYIDLTFDKMNDYIDIFNKYIPNDIYVVPTGKSLSIRKYVPKIDFTQEFDLYVKYMHECMKSVLELYEALKEINVLMMYDEVKKFNLEV